MNKIVSSLKEHPYLYGGVALVAVLFFMTRGSGNQQSAGDSALRNAYFQAEAIQAQSGAAIQVSNIQANRDTTLAQIAAGAKAASDTTWSSTSLAITQSNNAAATAALPYATQNNLIGALAGVASQTKTTTTGKSSSGFFGIGGGSSQTTTVAPTDAALHAGDYLSQLANGLFH